MTLTTYEIRISGLLSDDAIEEFADVRVTTTDVSTVLSGEITDQAALLGLLARLRVLGLHVLEVRRVLTPMDPPGQEPSDVAGEVPDPRDGSLS